ncbi:MAG: hypothetical protein ACI4GZ_05595 [Ruminococcus sp.]
MKIVRKAVLKEDKKLPIIMIAISVFMLLFSLVNISVDFTSDGVFLNIKLMNNLFGAISVIPLSFGICTALVLKFKKVSFSKMPAYIFCFSVLLVLILYYIAYGEKDIVYSILAFAVAVLLVYPFIIAVLTLEGRLYNRVFAVAFSGILLALCSIGAIIVCVILNSIMLATLIPVLIYVELILTVLCYDLKKPEKDSEYTSII